VRCVWIIEVLLHSHWVVCMNSWIKILLCNLIVVGVKSDERFNKELTDTLASVLEQNRSLTSLNLSCMLFLVPSVGFRVLNWRVYWYVLIWQYSPFFWFCPFESWTYLSRFNLYELNCIYHVYCSMLACRMVQDDAIYFLQCLHRHPTLSTLILKGILKVIPPAFQYFLIE
jgi:hypothetical protein